MDLMQRLDPEIAAVLPLLPAMDLTDIPAARATLMDMLAAANEGVGPSPNVIREDHMVPGLNGSPEVRVRHYRPASQSGVVPCLYWIHGGGHVLGQIEQDDPMMDHIVEAVGCAAVSVEWRRPPEHPFPAPMDDCYAGLTWTFKNAAELGVDPQRIAVGGASSGGGSAAGLALLARDRGEVAPAFQLLVYPMLDDRSSTTADQPHYRLWNPRSNHFGWTAYLGDADPRVAVPARRDDLSGLPPAWIGVGTHDLFHDEDLAYAERLRSAGVPCEVEVVPGVFHGFDLFVPKAQVSQRFFRTQCDSLRAALAG